MQKSESNALIFEKPMEGELRSLRMELSAEKKEEILYFVKNHNKLRFVDEYKEIQDQFCYYIHMWARSDQSIIFFQYLIFAFYIIF